MEKRVIGPSDGEVSGNDQSSDRFLIDAAQTQGRLSVVEHRIAPGVLAGPVHIHSKEDEYSYVLEGKVGAVFAGKEIVAEAGDLVVKPRGEWHTFWNAGDGPLRILELITPGGLEDMFRWLGSDDFDPDKLPEMAAHYGAEVDFAATEELMGRHGLRLE